MSKPRPEKLSIGYILRENALQIIMYILGAVIFGLVWWPLAIIYLAIIVATNIFYMYWVCPYCGHYALGTCAAGFDWLSGRHFKAELNRTFRGQFTLGTIVVGFGLVPAASCCGVSICRKFLMAGRCPASDILRGCLLASPGIIQETLRRLRDGGLSPAAEEDAGQHRIIPESASCRG